MNKGKHFTRVCLDCGRVMPNVAGNRRFCASCIRERRNRDSRESNLRNRPHPVLWYTVYSSKTGAIVAAGTSEMCAAKLGYKNANSFASAVGHGINGRGRHKCKKYTFVRERIDRREVDSLPPVRQYTANAKKKKPARVHSTDEPKG